MRKILSFIAIATIALSMASCGGNEPSQKDFQFQISALSGKARITIISADKDKFFVFAVRPYAESEGDIETVVQNYMSIVQERSYESLSGLISKERATMNPNGLVPNNQYIVMACYVEKDEETGKANLIGDIAFDTFMTMPSYTLNGEFSVSKEKKVHFKSGNVYYSGVYPYDALTQYTYYGKVGGETYDLLKWDEVAAMDILSADEWQYLFRGRNHADELFAHATIKVDGDAVHGLIILPDNWKKPENATLTTSKEMGIRWNGDEAYATSDVTFDGFAVNTFSRADWETLEFAGAVFLPAAGINGLETNSHGYYWSSTERPGKGTACGVTFSKNNVDLSSIMTTAYSKMYCFSVRAVRVLE